jgi:hypothetical protein
VSSAIRSGLGRLRKIAVHYVTNLSQDIMRCFNVNSLYCKATNGRCVFNNNKRHNMKKTRVLLFKREFQAINGWITITSNKRVGHKFN